ncbi:MAG: pyruvate carboxylase [Clostridia bacterium]|nr:pyruvate carboxylase [Clostridia bacterium]
MAIKKFNRVMVANRGEIAIRIFRACADLKMRTIAVYSKEDILNLFRTKADESYPLNETKSPLEAYLDIPYIIKLAKNKGVDAIHPGYGFLSENGEFARACEQAGITFIGPPSAVLDKMGDKLSAKELAKKCAVATVPGSIKPLADAEEAEKLAGEYGYPVILKAAAGGGGRGMRLVRNQNEMAEAFLMVTNEAKKAFGSEDIFIEKYLENPKHIEVQVIGDNYGNIIHLYERDCSVQRRYQKVVEFAPAFSVPEQKREELYRDALKIAKAVGYINAGTVEFLLDNDGNHYFIEMNPRIQVEHTVTEMVTGIDIVQTQLLIAQGYALDSPQIAIRSQQEVTCNGYSIQCRVTTEDPRKNFLPDTGKIAAYRSSGGFGVRLDAGNAYQGAVITPYYDSLLVKMTSHDRTFQGAINRALRSIQEIRIRGVKTNIVFVSNILNHPVFVAGRCHVNFIDNTPALFDMVMERDRGTKVLQYLGDFAVNNPCEKAVFDKPRLPQGFDEQSPPAGLKQLLDAKGPEAFCKWVLEQKKLLITDTTMRDAHQSLLATRMRTHDMLAVAPATAHILKDAFSLEMWGGATFDVAYRFLHESPWERLDELRQAIPNIPFQMLFRGANAVGYTNYPDNLIKEFIRESAASGIDVFRIFDSLNWLPGMELAIEEVIKCGKLAEGTICYSGDISDPKRDRYPLEYYINKAKELQKRGTHILGIKDMSGLLKPYAAKKLVTALKNEVDIPIHLHTHDTCGNQIAALMLASESGCDIVDCAISSLSSLTSQPSLNSLVAALEGSPRATGMDILQLQKLSDYWEDIRPMYRQFESGLTGPATDIYRYEIPGGQYTNLKPQVKSLGLGHRFEEVKEKFYEVNQMLGDIVKVTPSSKMVGDLAIFMVQNDLTADNIVEKAAHMAFPDSSISYFSGMMGQPDCGFPQELQKIVLKGQEPITCRPGEMLPPIDFAALEEKIKEIGASEPGSMRRSVISYALYPKVTQDYLKHRNTYADLSRIDTSVFFMGLAPGEITETTIADGKTLVIKYVGLGEMNDDGTRTVIFELNGARREIAVKDNSAVVSQTQAIIADPDDKMQVGTSLPGLVSKILVKEGDEVEENQTLAIIEAMKMETSVMAAARGRIAKIYVKEGQIVRPGELLIEMK